MFAFVFGLPFSNLNIALFPFRFASFVKSSEDIEAIMSLNSFGAFRFISLCCRPSNMSNAREISFCAFLLPNAAIIDCSGFVASNAPSRTFLILIASASRKSRGFDPPPVASAPGTSAPRAVTPPFPTIASFLTAKSLSESSFNASTFFAKIAT